MNNEAQTVSNFFSNNTGFGGYAVHNYQDAYLSGANNWNSPALPLP